MIVKVVAIGLDGTLLRDDCTVSERTREALRQAHQAGIMVIPSTGRQISYRQQQS